jgi:hypothetical protein
VDARETAAAIGVEFVGQMAHGEGTGAYAVRGADGTDAVLKLYTGDILDLGARPGVTDALRARGYPAPATLAKGEVDGIVYEIQELLPGAPVENLPLALVANVLELIALQRDVGLTGRMPWVDDIDFSPYNILAQDGRITGVVDWDGATSGDAAFDLVTLASYTYDYGVRDELLIHERWRSTRHT